MFAQIFGLAYSYLMEFSEYLFGVEPLWTGLGLCMVSFIPGIIFTIILKKKIFKLLDAPLIENNE